MRCFSPQTINRSKKKMKANQNVFLLWANIVQYQHYNFQHHCYYQESSSNFNTFQPCKRLEDLYKILKIGMKQECINLQGRNPANHKRFVAFSHASHLTKEPSFLRLYPILTNDISQTFLDHTYIIKFSFEQK